MAKHLCLHKGNGGDASRAPARRLSSAHHPSKYHNKYNQGPISRMDGRNQVTKLEYLFLHSPPQFYVSSSNARFPTIISRRTIDSVIIGYAKQTMPFFLVDVHLIMDAVSILFTS
jgi:hypothetical protein